MTVPSLPNFPKFLERRHAVREQATELWFRISTEKDPPKAQRVLEQLITNEEMKFVWDEIYRGRQGKRGQYFNPACLTNAAQAKVRREKAEALRREGGDENVKEAKFLAFEACLFDRLPRTPFSPDETEQDCAAEHFLARAYRIALDSKPVKLSSLQGQVAQIRDISIRLRALARELESLGEYVFPYYADRIDDVADDCENDAQAMTPNLVNSPWLIIREREIDPRVKDIVGRLAYCNFSLFMKVLPSTIAHVTNVIQACETPGEQARKMSRDTVLSILGNHHDLTVHSTFGPLLYPSFEQHDRKFRKIFGNKRSEID